MQRVSLFPLEPHPVPYLERLFYPVKFLDAAAAKKMGRNQTDRMHGQGVSDYWHR